MRERTIATSVIWIALAVSTGLILNTIRYTQNVVASPGDTGTLIQQTTFASTPWQIGAGVLVFMLIGCAMGATIAIWGSDAGKTDAKAPTESEKAKRDAREARIKRLLATLDDDDLDALDGIGDDGERVSVESLLKGRN